MKQSRVMYETEQGYVRNRAGLCMKQSRVMYETEQGYV